MCVCMYSFTWISFCNMCLCMCVCIYSRAYINGSMNFRRSLYLNSSSMCCRLHKSQLWGLFCFVVNVFNRFCLWWTLKVKTFWDSIIRMARKTMVKCISFSYVMLMDGHSLENLNYPRIFILKAWKTLLIYSDQINLRKTAPSYSHYPHTYLNPLTPITNITTIN